MPKDEGPPDTIRIVREVPASSKQLPAGGNVSVEDSARWLGVSDETIRRWIQAGDVQAVKEYRVHGRQGWRWVVPTSELNRLRRIKEKELRAQLERYE